MPSLSSRVLLRASESTWLAGQVQRRTFTRRAVRRFMPGESVADAVAAAAGLRDSGLGAIFTQLGENVTSEDDARAVGKHYREVLRVIAAERLAAQISVKPTQLGLDVDRDLCHESLDALLGAADGTVWVDMEDSRCTEVTLDLIQTVAATHRNVGVCLQAYLYRTKEDLAALHETDVAIRLVKGAYNEPASIAYPRKRDVDQSYRDLAEQLLRRRQANGPAPVFGTHDLNLVRHIEGVSRDLKLARDAYEVHMLYGIRSQEQQRLAASGTVVRVLVSYGNAWFPWYMRRLAERPANVWFVVKSLF